MKLPHAIQAILFATAEPHTYTALAKQLDTDTESIATAVVELKGMMEGQAITLIDLNQTVSLVTASEFSSLIETIRKDELSKELSKASAETLAIVAYSPGISKGNIEFIRGVNASYSLRALQMRGLIEQKGVGRATGYYPTLSVLEHFGVSKIEDLPEYGASKATLDALLSREDKEVS